MDLNIRGNALQHQRLSWTPNLVPRWLFRAAAVAEAAAGPAGVALVGKAAVALVGKAGAVAGAVAAAGTAAVHEGRLELQRLCRMTR